MKNLQIKQAFNHHGIVLYPENGTNAIDNLSTQEIKDALSRHGSIIFKNAAMDVNKFSDFIAKHSRKVTNDPARKASSENAQLIQAGDVAMGLHIENGSLPFLPELQWLYCEKAATKGSQTTLCDGVQVWADLSGKAKRQFLTKKIQYSRNMREPLWKKILSTELGFPLNEINETHIAYVNESIDGQTYQLNPDNSVYSRYKTWAAHPTQFSDELCFSNSMLGPSVNYEPPRITWEDGSVIAPSLWDEIIEVTEHHTDEINWEDGDMVVIDNTRIMHGRRKILDNNRRMFGGQSYLKNT